MELDYISMNNFRQYKDVKFNFSRDPSKRLTIIQGSNGAGKTNLLNAITWCLYNEELHIDTKYSGLPIVNTTTLKNKDNIIPVQVDIQLIQNGKKTLISRTKNYKVTENRFEELKAGQSLSIMREGSREWVGPIRGDDAQIMIDNMLPPSIEEYFFFDGEKMDAYFKQNTGTDIKQAVFDISQIQLLDNLIDHLAARRHNFLNAMKELNPKTKEKQELIDIHIKSRKSDTNKLKEILEQKNIAEREEKFYSEKLKDSSVERVKANEEQRDRFREENNRLKDQLSDLEDDRLKKINGAMPIIFLADTLLFSKRLIDQSKSSGKIPPLFEKIFISDLLKKGVCICKSDISNKDEFSIARRKNVEMYLTYANLSDISVELIDTNAHINALIQNIEPFPEEVKEIEKKYRGIEEVIEENDKLIFKYTQDILLSNLDNVKEWETQRQKFQDEKDGCKVQEALLNKNIERRDNVLRALNSEFKREAEKESKNNKLLTTLSFCDDGLKSAKNIKEKIMIELKNDIERKTSDQFLSLIWKKNTYTGVKINDSYDISVPHVSGLEGIGTLSAGERQVCALSFVASLNSVSGFEVPIIIDTPLARISDEPSKNIALNLPKYFENKQVIILVTEKEYSKDVKEALEDFVGESYKINVIEQELGNLAEVENA